MIVYVQLLKTILDRMTPEQREGLPLEIAADDTNAVSFTLQTVIPPTANTPERLIPCLPTYWLAETPHLAAILMAGKIAVVTHVWTRSQAVEALGLHVADWTLHELAVGLLARFGLIPDVRAILRPLPRQDRTLNWIRRLFQTKEIASP